MNFPMNTARSIAARFSAGTLLAFTLAGPVATRANVTGLIVEARETSMYNGQAFGTVGAYERISGRFTGELDPADPHNRIINDLDLAPRNARGKVEYEATFWMLKPLDMTKASGILVYNVPNRGRATILGTFSQGGEPGDGFFFRRGDVVLSSGWQGDLAAGTERVVVPVAKNKDGSSITGPVLARFSSVQQPTPSLTLPGGRTLASLETSKATLTKRKSENSAVIPIGAADWAFSDSRTVAFPGTPDETRISVKGGFEAGYLYELSYLAKDPPVLGIGLAATRDLVSFFRRDAKDPVGVDNPVAGRITHVVAQGDSQSGNVVKTFIHLGFNADEKGRIVWDGANDHIAARQTPLNFRFAIPGGATALYEPGSEPVLWWSPTEDKARGRPTASLLDRARATNTVPKIIETFGASEFWGLRFSPGLVGTLADKDIPLPPEVRRYYFPGTTHGGGRGGFSTGTPNAAAAGRGGRGGGGVNEYGLSGNNPNPQKETHRALLLALIDWVTKGIEPPPSQYPRLDRGELVRPEAAAMGFPHIPGVALPDHLLNPVYDYDFGPGFIANDMSGAISLQPPIIRQIIPSLVPKVNADGNETSGVPSVLHQVPLGSYLGWNVTTNGFYAGMQSGFAGSFIPFAQTKAEREAAGDPRPSLQERYGTHEKYVELVRAAAAKAVASRFLLPEDADRLIAAAVAGNVLTAP